ncbi:phosphoribosylformylglycinamidine synthase [Chitinivibrio alkaliphilus]|uniref:Phosphoribosylformylglycinamidine synthase n=1 Tax=Chitinivibrio alkaliphilus ACht1 TaxID=1313304 RepID=U7D7Z2_9BACT|nr:phosphoribosylformylglycinamidine synthase [Chitinivibrio alkaliphilus]ERP39070.1 phosphoribosylformylglycinamidine synthase [Chitinivibrio alkaliphilus ACht1]
MVRRLFVEKKPGFNIAARRMKDDLRDHLNISHLRDLRILIRYDVEGLSETDFTMITPVILSEPPVDTTADTLSLDDDEHAFAIEYLPGQFDQRADSAAQAIQIMTHGELSPVRCAEVIVLKGPLSTEEIDAVKTYLINPVDSHEASMDTPETLQVTPPVPKKVAVLEGFIEGDEDRARALREELGLAMNREDILHCQAYFRDEEKRNPTITEIKLLDTYWSDHCRHTTFMTRLRDISIEEHPHTAPVKKALADYRACRKEVYGDTPRKAECLMDIAVIAMKHLRAQGKLADLEVSNEVNACSIEVEAETMEGKKEPWLLMFKNETHNHPTEIEPFGGAATCLGGAIRDPLSGRSYVYQAMRVSGADDPRTPLDKTLPGKLPQRKICVEAAEGYSSYGNQIGLATGLVDEIYHSGYRAKRMEVGAVVAGAPKKNVLRGEPAPGDCIILIGGRTGRDGCGGATGSSKAQTEESVSQSGAEVQKGNPPTERKLQRLFRNPEFSTKIKVCNDFGAGGVAVAIGEIAEGLIIDLDAVPTKYTGLDGTELAISESQERMAVCIDRADREKIIALSREENLEAVSVAEVTQERRVIMQWRGDNIVNLSRDFIDTNGVLQSMPVSVTAPEGENPLDEAPEAVQKAHTLPEKWYAALADLNVCSKKGLVERFDSTIGAGSILLPFGGKYQETPTQVMAAKLPMQRGDSRTASLMSYGFDPTLSSWSPFHGALYAVVESVARIVAAGGSRKRVRLSLQEYFERLGDDPAIWGKPLAALLGALHAQRGFGTAAIGGKDSMSGTYEDISVPPTLISFAVAPASVDTIISPELKNPGNYLSLLSVPLTEEGIPDFPALCALYDTVTAAIADGTIVSAHTVGPGGIAGALSKMAFGNKFGANLTSVLDEASLFTPEYGALICESSAPLTMDSASILGQVQKDFTITMAGFSIDLEKAHTLWATPLEDVYPTTAGEPGESRDISYSPPTIQKSGTTTARPRVFIPVFPGTNCEYDTARAFERAGGIPQMQVLRNLTRTDVEESISRTVEAIKNAQILMFPGGFSAGDEPEGSGKFIASYFRNPRIQDAVMELLNSRDGLILGICNGFQALIKLGLLPYGEICELRKDTPTLTFNTIGRHVSQMVATKISSTLSPWFHQVATGDLHSIAVSHGEGRFFADEAWRTRLAEAGQIATQYVDLQGKPTEAMPHNPNGSVWGIEGITSPDGRILGKMGHSERIGTGVGKNIHGEKDQKIFQSGVKYFL